MTSPRQQMPASPNPMYSIKGTDFYSLFGYKGRVLKPLPQGSTTPGVGGYSLWRMCGQAKPRDQKMAMLGVPSDGKQQPCVGKMEESRMKLHFGKFLLQRRPLKQGIGGLRVWIHGEF